MLPFAHKWQRNRVTENFYEHEQTVLEKIPKYDMLHLMGDLNAKFGRRCSKAEKAVSNEAVDEQNENGELLITYL